MKRPLTVLLFLTIAGVAASAQGPAQKYRAPRPTAGHPDLQGVWNFTSGVPMQRPAAFATKKMFTREEFEARRNMVRTALSSLGKIAPVEDVGLDWLEGKLYVDDLRTSLITYPDNGRLPATLDGVRRMPNIEDLIGLFADSKTGPPPQLGALIAAFSGGKKDSVGGRDARGGDKQLRQPAAQLCGHRQCRREGGDGTLHPHGCKRD